MTSQQHSPLQQPAADRPRPSLTLLDWALAGVLAAGALVAYVVTLAPGLLLNDSAEFQTLAYTVGHTHPTGYPVYVLLAHVATWLPVESVAWRVNLFSAVCGGAAAGTLFLLLRLLTGRRWLPAAAAVQLAVSPTFWSQAIIAEVYVPAATVTCGVLLCLVLWRRTGRAVHVFAAGALGGLSLGVHLTVALMAPAAVVFVALERPGRVRHLSLAAAGALTGAVLTLAAFFIVDQNRPPSDYFRAVVEPSRSEWGLSAEQIDGFGERLRFSLSAVQYADNLQRRSLDEVLNQASEYLRNLPRELPWLWLAAAVVGTFRLIAGHGRFAFVVLATLAVHAAYLARHDMGDIQVAYIPTYVLLTVLAACCLGVARPEVSRTLGASGTLARRARWSRVVEAVVACALLAATAVPLFQAGAWTDEGRRAVWVPEGEPPFEVELSERLHATFGPMIAELDPGAIVFCEWSHLYAFYYLAHVEQRRTDLVFVQAYPALGQTRLARSALEFIRANADRRAVYLLEPLAEVAAGFDLAVVDRGGVLLFRIVPRGQPIRGD